MIATSPTTVELGRRRATRQSRYAEELAQGLARELHDSVAQTLTTMLITMEEFKREQAGRRSVIDQVGSLQEDTREALNSIRQLLHELRGESGETADFIESLRRGPIRRLEQETEISVQLMVSDAWPRVLRAQPARHLFRIIQEALSNVRLHSGARAVCVALEAEGEHLSIEVRDDGRGLELENLGMGLRGMRERVAILGGALDFESQPGRGTTVRVSLPIEPCIILPLEACA